MINPDDAQTSLPEISLLMFEPNQSSSLKQNGWEKISGDPNNLPLAMTQLAAQLGGVVYGRQKAQLEVLRPKPKEIAHKNSLSAVYGLRAFPFHIDTSHHLTPCRFIVLGCVQPGNPPVSTEVIEIGDLAISSDKRKLFESALFFVNNGHKSFYSTILSPLRPYVRYDGNCMRPTDRLAEEAILKMEKLIGEVCARVFYLQRGDILILDNWRTFHRRGGYAFDPSRTLLRTLVA